MRSVWYVDQKANPASRPVNAILGALRAILPVLTSIDRISLDNDGPMLFNPTVHAAVSIVDNAYT